MLKHKKLVSIIATLAFCLSFLAPALIAPAPAVAADMYSVIKTASVNPDSSGYVGVGAVVKVTIPDIGVASESRVTVSMPSQWKIKGNVKIAKDPVADAITLVGAENPTGLDLTDKDTMLALTTLGSTSQLTSGISIAPNKSFDIQLHKTTGEKGANKYFYIYFNGIDVNNMTGDLTITFMAPNGSVFQTAQVSLGKSSRSGDTLTTIKKVNSLVAPGGTLDIITVTELQAGTITKGDKIELKILTNGVTWDTGKFTGTASETAPVAAYGWDWSATGLDWMGNTNTAFSGSDDTLKYTVQQAKTNEPGRISFTNLPILIDDAKAKPGDVIKIKLSGADMTSATIEVAKYADFGLTYKEGTPTEAIAGHDDQTIGNFIIVEDAYGSWIKDRTVKLTLPSGVKWHDEGDLDIVNEGDIGNIKVDFNTDRDVLTLTPEVQSQEDASEIDVNDFSVDISPDFKGELEVKVSGSAGLSGTLKVADVKPAVAISAKSVKDVNLGLANQALDDIVLTEGIAEGLLDDEDLVLELDEGYRFSKEPTVKVTEGDLDIDEDGIKLANSDRRLVIPIESDSSIASTIVISDVYVDAQRIAPEGPIYLKVASWDEGSKAIMAYDDFAQNDRGENNGKGWTNKAGDKAIVGKCVTPGSITGRNATFYIGSTIMNVNGSNVIMDVAPYIKAGRTYVPVRFLGDALAAATAWDEATKTVTITKEDKTVVLVIGSKTAKVNGADVAMDVAPEIVNGRTMLPARYVAEGLGYTVGWNEALKQVIIQ